MAGGRPVLYETPEEVQTIIKGYFEEITYTHPESGQTICKPTMSGLAYALDMSRQSLINYSNKEEFFDTIKKARNKVEAALENNLYSNAVAGTIFNLKNNFNWKDKTEVDNRISLTELTDEQLAAQIKALTNG